MPITMYALPVYPNIPLSTIVWTSSCALGGGNPLSTTAPTSAIYSTANRAQTYPFVIHDAVTVYKFFVVNGTVVSGNFDIGIYTKDYKLLVSTGTTVQAGTSVIQQVTLGSPIALPPGQYFMAFACDNITARFFQQSPSSGVLTVSMCKQMATAFVLPGTFTPAEAATLSMPIYGAKLINV